MPKSYNCSIVFVIKNWHLIVKIDGVTSSYKTDTPTAKSDMSQNKKSELEKDIDCIYCAKYS